MKCFCPLFGVFIVQDCIDRHMPLLYYRQLTRIVSNDIPYVWRKCEYVLINKCAVRSTSIAGLSTTQNSVVVVLSPTWEYTLIFAKVLIWTFDAE